MSTARKSRRRPRRGAVLLLAMVFIVIFSALAVAVAGLSGANVQVASNQHRLNTALNAAHSGLECARYLVTTAALGQTNTNYVTDAQADQAWAALCAHIQATALDGQAVASPTRFTDAGAGGDRLTLPAMDFGDGGCEFILRFSRYDSDPRVVCTQSFGAAGQVSRAVGMSMEITKDRGVLEYAVASRGRTWLTGDTTIDGDLFSAWNRAEVSPFNVTSDSSVVGTINTVLALDQIDAESYDMETLDVNDCPISIHGGPLGEDYENRYYSPRDEVQGYHEGVNYGQPYNDLAGMDISHYNTDGYTADLTAIPSCPTASRVVEYFPHSAGDYCQPRDRGSTSFTRHVYENQTFTDALLPVNRHALFRNCTFEGVLYVDCYKSNTNKSYTNNVRFENCTFDGVIVTDTPQSLNWKNNCLYFTGEAAFNNQSDVPEATILAPHFNVNLGNTNPQQSDSNVLTGAIVGGIVDVRGNAQINGTIVSMCDTTRWTSGYVTNIGATLDDGGSETTELGDIGTIGITPDEDMMLPSGITSPIIIKPDPKTYSEGF